MFRSYPSVAFTILRDRRAHSKAFVQFVVIALSVHSAVGHFVFAAHITQEGTYAYRNDILNHFFFFFR